MSLENTSLTLCVHVWSCTGISQRDYTNHYDHLLPRVPELRTSIATFFVDSVRHVFSLESYSFDVYLESSGRVWLIDFAPLNDKLDYLLFSRADLDRLAGECAELCGTESDAETVAAACEFRTLDASTAVQPGKYSAHRVPYEVASASTTDEIVQLATKLKRMQGQE